MLCSQLTESLQKVAPHADDFDIALRPDKNGRIPEVKGMPTIDTDINKPRRRCESGPPAFLGCLFGSNMENLSSSAIR